VVTSCGQAVAGAGVGAPWLHAVMLEQAEITVGMRCLEIGLGRSLPSGARK
jgi:protein-L-isoaspartate O-methyltransferase